jgi:hypothetical protein
MASAYRYHERVLKLLQWRCPPRRWWLKSPAHMATIEALVTVYPDARFVMTHRDVSAVMPSLCALKAALTGPLTEGADPVALGRRETEQWEDALRRTLVLRDAGREDRFFDVSFDRMQASPLEAVADLYRALGDELDDDSRARMARWWRDNAEERRSSPRPDPATFGLSAAELRRRFAFYHRRFGIPSEG